MRRIAVIGSGISGLAVSYHLQREARVTLFEADRRLGGHTHTVDVTIDGVTHGVDTGFLVLNERTYPHLLSLFGELDVSVVPSDMSFSVQVPDTGFEWSGSNLDGVFAQRTNLFRPGFWRMLADILRFNRLATSMARDGSDKRLRQPIGEFLRVHRFSTHFRDGYFLPMIGCIWSCPTDQMLAFPMATMIRFCHNHGLIQISNRPRWFTVKGGARHYVDKMLAHIPDVRPGTPVRQVRRDTGAGARQGATVVTDGGSEHFDDVVLACHSDQALAVLADPSAEEREILGAIRYHPNRAVLHTDVGMLPRRTRAWAAWNYERAAQDSREQANVCLHYLINKLQPLPWTKPVVVSLNPVRDPSPACVIGEYAYSHPVFDQAAIDAQVRLPSIQGHRHTWFCGAWARYGFHEDGLMSGLAVVGGLRAAWAGPQALGALKAA